MKNIYKCSVDELAYAFKIILTISTEALESNSLISKLNIHKKTKFITHFNEIITYCLHQAAEIKKKIKQKAKPLKMGSL